MVFQEMRSADIARMERSRLEAASLPQRLLRCPYCHFIVQQVCLDVCGHFTVKCRKCKQPITFNLKRGSSVNFRRAASPQTRTLLNEARTGPGTTK